MQRERERGLGASSLDPQEWAKNSQPQRPLAKPIETLCKAINAWLSSERVDDQRDTGRKRYRIGNVKYRIWLHCLVGWLVVVQFLAKQRGPGIGTHERALLGRRS